MKGCKDRPWSNAEDEELLRLRADKFTRKEIAEEMGRTFSAVTRRIMHLNRRSRMMRIPKPAERIVIAKPEVPDFYALGWRFVGFERSAIVMNWGGESAPRWPLYQQRAAA